MNKAAFTYPTAEAAQNVVAANTPKWEACEGASWGATDRTLATPRDIFWSGGPVQVGDDGVVTMRITQENGNDWACWRAMSVAANVVNDVTVCGINPPAAQIAAATTAIAAKVPTR